MAWGPAAITAGASLLGGLLGGNAASDAASTQANAQLQAAQIAAQAAKFTPVGITSNYASSNFGYDPSGRLNSAGYTLNPQMQAYQNQLMGMLGGNLGQYGQAQQLNQPVLNAAQGMFNLGQGYLQQNPQEQAAQYLAQQRALLAPSDATAYANLQNNMFNTGRQGLAVGGGNGMAATNPEYAAYYNALAQRDMGLAAQAQAGGQANAQFGAGMLGTGTNTLRDYYANQAAAAQPWQTTMGLSQGLEGLGQNTLQTGAALGGQQAAAGAMQGSFLNAGGSNAANSMFNANAYSPVSSMLMGAGNALNNYQQQQFNNNLLSKMFTQPSPWYTSPQPSIYGMSNIPYNYNQGNI